MDVCRCCSLSRSSDTEKNMGKINSTPEQGEAKAHLRRPVTAEILENMKNVRGRKVKQKK